MPLEDDGDDADRVAAPVVISDEVQEVLSVLNLETLDTKEHDEEEEEKANGHLSKSDHPNSAAESGGAASVSTDESYPGPSTSRHSTRARRPAPSKLSHLYDMGVEVKKECAEDEVARGLVQNGSR